jgi:hypothetical protein
VPLPEAAGPSMAMIMSVYVLSVEEVAD